MLGLLLLNGTRPATAAAQTAGPPSPQAARATVILHVVGELSAINAARRVLEDYLAAVPQTHRIDPRNTLDLSVARAGAEPEDYSVEVWVDLRGPSSAAIYLFDRVGGRVLLRDVPLDAGGLADEVALETIGQILRTSLSALARGEAIGPMQVDVHEELLPGLVQPDHNSATERRPRRSPRIRQTTLREPWMLRIELGYELQVYSPELPTHGLSFALEAAPPPLGDLRLGARLEGVYRAPAQWSAVPVGAVFEQGAVRALASLRIAPESWLRISAALGAALVVNRVSPRSDPGAPESVVLAEDRTRTDPALTFSFAASFVPIDAMIVALRTGLDIDLLGARYVIARNEGDETILAPPLGRFFLMATLGATFDAP